MCICMDEGRKEWIYGSSDVWLYECKDVQTQSNLSNLARI